MRVPHTEICKNNNTAYRDDVQQCIRQCLLAAGQDTSRHARAEYILRLGKNRTHLGSLGFDFQAQRLPLVDIQCPRGAQAVSGVASRVRDCARISPAFLRFRGLRFRGKSRSRRALPEFHLVTMSQTRAFFHLSFPPSCSFLSWNKKRLSTTADARDIFDFFQVLPLPSKLTSP